MNTSTAVKSVLISNGRRTDGSEISTSESRSDAMVSEEAGGEGRGKEAKEDNKGNVEGRGIKKLGGSEPTRLINGSGVLARNMNMSSSVDEGSIGVGRDGRAKLTDGDGAKVVMKG